MDKNIKVKVEINEFKNLFQGQKDVIFFIINLQYQKKNWTIQKRYSELSNLYSDLKKNHGNLPIFPPRTLFPLTKYEDIDKRRSKLDLFLKTIFERQDMYKNLKFLSFFKIKDNLKLFSKEYLKLDINFENKALGFRDFNYHNDQKLFITLLSDMNAISRVDSYFTNFKMPWESRKKDEVIFSVGLLELYVIKPQSKMKFLKVFNLSFPSQAICCTYNEVLNIFAVGCDDGELAVYLLNKKEKPYYKVLFKQKIHGGRIMGVQIDGLRNLIYSAGEDGKLQTVDLNTLSLVGSVFVSSSKLCEFIFYSKEKKSFLTDRQGCIHIFDNIPTTPKRVHLLHTDSNSTLRGLSFDPKNNNIYTVCYNDGRIYGYHLGDDLKDEIIPEKILNILGEKGGRQICYINSTNQIVVGYASGIITFYDLNNSKTPYYSRKIHTSDITQVKYKYENDLLITSSKDCTVKFWHIQHGNDKAPIKEKIEKVKIDNKNNPFEDNEDLNDFGEKENVNFVDENQGNFGQRIIQEKVKSESEESDDDLAGWNA